MHVLRTDSIQVEIHPDTLTLRVRDLRTGIVWQMQEAGPGDIGLKGHAGPWEGLAFRTARSITWEGNDHALHARLSHWPLRSNVWGWLDFVVEVHFAVEDDRLHITVSTANGRGESSFIDSYYPRGFLFPSGVAGDLVLPYGQGCLLSKDTPVTLNHTMPVYSGSGFVMPWWGQLAEGGEGLIALVDTPDDLGIRLATEPEAGHTAHPYWEASLGNFAYPRAITYQFFARTDITGLAKAYRRHAEARGQAVTLREKTAARPHTDLLRGGLVLNLWHESYFGYFNGDTTPHHLPFTEGLHRYQRLVRDAGITRGVAHIDGWGRKGYDVFHPDILPPDPDLGGWEGLRALADAIQNMGHLFMLHDNYVDIYANSESFDPDCTTLDLSGRRPESAQWLGGRQQWLCPDRTMPFVTRNLAEVRDRVRPSATFLDCHTMGHLRECYDQRHPCSRGGARQAWTDVFAWCQQQGWVTGSEGGADWAIPVLDFAENVPVGCCPFDLSQTLNGPLGDPIPLYNLVWHDCIVNMSYLTELYNEEKALWLMLWGGIPSLRPSTFMPDSINRKRDDHETVVDAVRNLRPITDLALRVGFEEMTALDVVDRAERMLRTTFADGTQVSVDFTRRTYDVRYPDGTPSAANRFAVPAFSA